MRKKKTMNKTERRIHEDRMRALDEERVRMVERHEKPVLIHAVSEAYLREREILGLNAPRK